MAVSAWRIGAVALLVAGMASFQAQSRSADQPPPAYVENCASCHGTALEGATGPNIGPALRGPGFAAKWRGRPAADFLAFVHATMPLSQPGSLDPKTSAEAAN